MMHVAVATGAKNNVQVVLLQYTFRFPAAAQSKAQVCGRVRAGIMGSNPTGGIDVCLL
jgi:hypothetical protein